MNTRRRVRVAIALASCALITAPAAQAALLQGDEQALSFTTAATPIVAAGDDHARNGSAPVFPPHGGIPLPSARTSSSQTATASGGFDWEDAGVGFGTAAGIALLAAGTLMSTRKLRGPRVSSV